MKTTYTSCPRCAGTGQYHVHGACYQCGGSGRVKAPRQPPLLPTLRRNRDRLIQAVRVAKVAGTGCPKAMAETVQRARRINHNLVRLLRSISKETARAAIAAATKE